MTKTIAILFALTFASTTFAADLPEIVKKGDLPVNLQGRTVKVGKADTSGIPTCFQGDRAKLPASNDTIVAWAADHAKHACASASTVYVCRAGKNLSVRCE